MSYQVLARKWRPKRFAELVGQEHVVRALSHALSHDRVHHAYLFSGTRGVGKTTIARIFAKSLNCLAGISAEPCGVCDVCVDVDAGRFLDLVEIDAASNTSVDDVREVIEKAQYLPARGRYKVYLIDEVHMLSRNAFNALLKTLEEPPDHAKFLLATTDPEKLPVTVLSRCLQFNLKRLSQEQIQAQLAQILVAEAVLFEAPALDEIARAGEGSLRDALSLLDQAIAFGGGEVKSADVHSMLGTIDRGRVLELLQAIVAEDPARLWAEAERIAEIAPDFREVLNHLAALLHRVQLAQLLDGASLDQTDAGAVAELAQRIAPEHVQLLYQLAITGARDLRLAPSARVGFDMALLRMLAFAPDRAAPVAEGGRSDDGLAAPGVARATAPSGSVPAAPSSKAPLRRGRAEATGTASAPSVAPLPLPSPTTSPTPAVSAAVSAAPPQRPRRGGGAPSAGEPAQQLPQASEPAVDPRPPLEPVADWLQVLARSGLSGPARELANNTVAVGYADGLLRLVIDPAYATLNIPRSVERLAQVLSPLLGTAGLRIVIESSAGSTPSPAAHARGWASARQIEAEAAVQSNPFVRDLVEQFGAQVLPNSIRPINPE